jgi:3-oxoacyl-[acyl-carrier-protein] synthase II
VKRRVVITGCGALTAAGNTLDGLWSALLSGKSLVGKVTNFACPELEVLSGAELVVPGSDTLPATVDSDPFRARCCHIALAAARAAVSNAGLRHRDEGSRSPLPATRGEGWGEGAGIVLGSTMAEDRQVGDLNERWLKQGPDSVDGGWLGRADNHKLAASIAAELGLSGPVWLNATACSSGNAAVAWAFDFIADGTADVMLAGGADTFTRALFCGFARMSALSKSVCKPFDKNRDGVSFGEGAGILVMEELEHARQRGARVLAEVVGYGLSNDAYHVTAPEPNGAGFVRAIVQALATSSTPPDAIGYVCAHGTGTQYNDQGEVRALKTVFGERATAIPTSSIKSAIGHTNGAAGAIATIACVLALLHQTVPPTANLAEPDPEFGMDFVMGGGRPVALSACLNMAAGFGGSNVCLLLARAP